MNDNVFEIILKLILIFLPFALIPFTFKLAGGVISKLYGVISGAGAGRVQRARQRSAERTAARRQQFFKGSRFAESSRMGRAFNVVGRRAGAGFRGRYGLGQRGREAIALGQSAGVEETLKANPLLQQLAMDDDANAVMALSGGSAVRAEQVARKMFFKKDAQGKFELDANGNKKIDEKEVARTVAAAKAVGINRANATAALTTMAQNKSRAIGAGQFELVEEGIKGLAQGNQTMEDNLSYNYQFHSRNAGRIDLGGSWHDTERKTITDPAKRARAVMLNGLNRTDMVSLLRGYGNQVEMAGTAIQDVLTDPSADTELKKQAAMRALEMQSNLSYATGENALKVNKLMLDLGVKFTGEPGGIEKQIAGLAGIDAETLRASARVYDKEQYRGEGTKAA